MKRATCLLSTKERLKEVGIILDKVLIHGYLGIERPSPSASEEMTPLR